MYLVCKYRLNKTIGQAEMKYRFKAVKYSEDVNLFDRSYNSHEAAMQAAFAYVDLFVENDSAKEKLVHGVISDLIHHYCHFHMMIRSL